MEHQDSFNEKSQNEDMNLPVEEVSSDDTTPATEETVEAAPETVDTPTEEAPTEEAPTEEAPKEEKPAVEQKPAPEKKAEAPVAKLPFTQHKLFKPLLIGAISLVAVVGIIVAIVLLGGGKDCSHDWSDWSVEKEATCLATGTKSRKCSKCEDVEYDTIEKAAHSLGDLIPATEATCADGTIAHRVCSVCQGKFGEDNAPLDSVRVPAIAAHTWVPATCVTAKTCSVCGLVDGEAHGHNLGPAATCTAPQICTECTEVIVAQLPHTPGADATCTTAQTCTSCQDVITPALGHVPNIPAATCTDDQICTRCEDVIVPHTGHDYDETVWVTDGESHWHECHCGDKADLDSHTGGTATCTERAVCEVCSKPYGNLAHSFTRQVQTPVYVATPADCDNAATYYYVCEYCDEHNEETYTYGDALGHAWGAWTSVDAENHKRICSNDPTHVQTEGHKGGTASCTERAVCTECNTEYGAEPSHDWGDGEVISEPDCENDGVKKYICSECSETHLETITSPGHDYVGVVTNPTCGEGGYTTYTCSVCSDSYKGNYTNPTGEHNLPTRSLCTDNLECADCDYVEVGTSHNHEVTDTKPATCNALKTLTYTCTECTHSYEATEGDYAPHTFTATITTEATCGSVGLKTYTCTVCGHTQTEDLPINGSHTWDQGTTVGNVTTFECTVCDDSYTTIVSTESNVNVSSGDLGSAGSVDLPDASLNLGELLEDGEALAGKDVNISAEKLNAEEVLTPEQLALLNGQTTVYNFTIKEGESYISNFGDKYVTVTLPYTLKPGEDVDSIVIWYIKDDGELVSMPATYANGKVSFRTNHFSYYTVANVDPSEICELVGEHNYQYVPYTGKTCGDENYVLKTCTRCGHAEKEDVEIIIHNYESTVTPPTCTTDGKTVYTCSKCGDSYETPIAATGHSFTVTRVEATCTLTGSITQACVHCDLSYVTTIPKLQHTFTDSVVLPTCDSRGYTTHTCECGESYIDSYVAATGHSYTVEFEWSDDHTEATLVARCGNDDSHVQNVTAQVTVYENNPTCLEHHVTTYIARATFAGAVYTATYEATGDLGDHLYSTVWSYDENNHWHACILCSEAKADLAEHEFSNSVVTTAPGCLTTGNSRTTCDCGARHDKTIDALGHDVVSTVIAPTCEKAGYTLHECSRCDYSYTDTTVSALGHNYVASFTWADDFTSATLTLVCQNDSKHVRELAAIIHIDVTPATCTTPSVTTYKAQVDYNGTYTDEKSVVGELAPHTFGTVLKYDQSGHWYECAICGAKDQLSNHTYGEGKVISAATCVGEGVMTYTCSCGYEKSEKIPATGNHSYENGICSVCGKAENSCDHTTLTLHIVDLHKEYGACEGSYIVYESCDCGAVANLVGDGESFNFCGDIEYESENEIEEENYERYEVVARCPECNLYFEGYSEEKIENCQYVYGIVIETLSVDGRTVADGIEIFVEEGYEHTEGDYTVIDLSEYGACAGELSIMTCRDCGILGGMEEPELECDIDIEKFESETLEDGTQRRWIDQTCTKCGLRMFVESTYKSGCYYVTTMKVLVTLGDEVIADYEASVSEEDHSYNSNNYKFELTGEDCSDVYAVIGVCSDCGYEELRYYDIGHRSDRMDIDLSGLGICGIVDSDDTTNGNKPSSDNGIYCYGCRICGEVSSEYYCNLYSCKMSYEETYDEVTGKVTTTRTCIECGIVVTSVHWSEEIDECTDKHYQTLTLSRAGEVLATYDSTYNVVNHLYVYSYELDGETCSDGYRVSGICYYCGDKDTYKSSGHQERLVFHYETDGNDGHGHSVSHYACACGKRAYVSDDASSCENCGFTVTQDNDVTTDGCVVTETASLTVKLGEDTLYTWSYSTSYENHDYVSTKTTGADGTTIITLVCSVCSDENTTTLNNAELEYSEEDNEYHYDFEYTPTADGTYVIYSLANRDTYVTLYKYVDGKLEKVSYDDDGANNNGNFRLEYKLTAGVTYVYRIRNYQRSESGTIPYIFRELVSGGCNHDYENKQISELAPGAVDCEGGRQIFTICTACGEIESIEITTMHYYHSERFDLTEVGACYGYIEYQICDCGKVSDVWYDSCAYNYSGSDYIDDFNNPHKVESMSCLECGLLITRDMYELEDGCYRYSYITYTVTLGDEVLLSLDQYSYYQNHDYEVSYNLRGKSCTDGVDYIYTCRDCGNSYTTYYSWHNTHTTVEYDLSEYGCGGYIRKRECPCGESKSVDYEFNCKYTYNYREYEVDGVTYYENAYTCSDCGLNFLRVSYTLYDGCNGTNYVAVNLSYNGTPVISDYMYVYGTTIQHTYERTYKLLGESCTDGVEMIDTCVVCGHTYTETYNDHRVHSVYSFSSNEHEGACDYHSFTAYECACGEVVECKYGVVDCECGFKVQEDYNETADGCNITVEIAVRVSFNGVELYTYEETANKVQHSYEINKSVEENGDTVYTLVCTNCGAQDVTTVHHAELNYDDEFCNYSYRFVVTPDVSGYYVIHSVICRDTYVELHAYDEYGNLYQLSSNDDGFGNGDFLLNYYLNAGVTYVYEIRYYYEYDNNGDIDFVFMPYVECSHEDTVEMREFISSQKNCDSGSHVTRICTDCGRIAETYLSYGHRYEEIYYDLSEYGACGGYIEIGTCIMCGESYMNSSIYCWSYEEYDTVEIDGVTHEIYKVWCDKCGIVSTSDYYYADEGCFKAYYEHIVVEIGEVKFETLQILERYEDHTPGEGEILRQPTCYDFGEFYGTCALCGIECYIELPKTEHDYEVTIYEPDCWNYGYTYYCCLICGQTEEKDYVEPSHDYQLTEVIEPTCNSYGYSIYHCSICGSYEERDHVDPTGEHSYESRIFEADCWNDGYTYYWCIYCNEGYYGDYVEASHDYQLIETIEPTCNSYGYSIYCCSRCGGGEERDHVEPTGEHNYELWYESVADEYNHGYSEYQCVDCGIIYTTDYVAPAGHMVAVKEVVAPNCMNGGFTVYYCDTCGFCYESDFTPVSDHNYDVKTVAPTCESDGYTVFFCKDCGITVEGDTVPALGHSYSDYEEAPTCTKSGVIGERCDNCGMTAIYETIPALGHKWELVNSEAPTCVKAGYDVYACPDCGESYKDNLTEATGEHNYSDGFCIWCGRDENYVCEHELTKEVILDLHELGACENTYLIYLTCECGEVKQLFDPESIYLCESMQFEYEMTESDTEISRRSIGHCEFCGLSVIGDTYGYREGCVIYQSLTVRDLMLNGVRISDDISYSISEEYHENVELEIIHLDEEYGACEGGYIEVERCKDCGKATEILDIQLGCEIDTIENTEDEFGGVYSKMESTCEQCGIRFVIEGYELSTECGHLYELHVLINDKDGNEIVDADIVDEERDHDYYYDYVLYGDDCTGLYKVIRLCSYCDYREEYFTFGRHLYRDLEFALGDYGCNGTLDGRFCVICGYTDNYHLDFVCDLIEVDREEYQDDEGNTHTRIVAECTVCGLQYIGDGWAISNDCYEGNAATLEIISGEFHFSFCTDEMREYHDYEYTITYDGVEDCDDGVTVTMVCRNCNKTSSFHTTGHNPCIKEFVRLSEYGCCNHYYVINRCPCGEYEYEEFDTSHCEKCGYEMTGEGDKFNYGCRVEETVITNIVVNGKIVKTFSKTRVYSEHNYTVTNVVVSGGVYYVCTRCENCGAYSEREIITAYVEKQDDGCYYEYVYIPANSGNYIVESVSDDDTYAVLGIYDENGKFIELKSDDDDGFNTNFRIEYYLEADRVYVYRIRYLDHDKEGEILFNITIADSMCDHNSGGSVVDYAVGDSPCKDGIFHITICDECGEAVSVYATYEHNYEYFYIDLTEYGFCGGSASGNVCACGEGNIYVGMGCNQSTIESDRTETVNDNGDTCIVITGFCPTCQMYYIHETLITTENCVRYVTENHFVYKGEELIYEATNTRNYEHHDFVNTHPEIDSCLDGFEITSTCRDCGYSTSIYYDHHAPVYEERVDAADCGMCGDNYVTVTRCACGAPEGITINYNLSGCTIDYRYDYYTDENGYSHTVDIMYCTECGMEAYFDKYRLSEGCTNYTYNIFSFVMNGEVLIDAVEYLYMKSDKHDMIVDGFKLDGETCDYGYTLYYTCKACGIKSESYRIGHSYKYEMIEDLSKYGACGAQLVFNTCPCGLEGTVEFIFGDCETVFDEETLEDVDGNEVHAMYYVCEKCGMRVEIYEVFLMSGSYSTRYDVVISGPDGKQTSMSFYK